MVTRLPRFHATTLLDVDKTQRAIDEFIDSLPEVAQADIRTLHTEIAAVMDGLPMQLFEGTFWGGSEQHIIGYGTYSYQRSDGKQVEWFVVGLAQQKNYISVYLSAVEDGQYVSEKYGKDLGKVKVGKSSISFGSVADIDVARLKELVTKARALQAN
jgi:hypothetical protein